jgi:hypothetical protein
LESTAGAWYHRTATERSTIGARSPTISIEAATNKCCVKPGPARVNCSKRGTDTLIYGISYRLIIPERCIATAHCARRTRQHIATL